MLWVLIRSALPCQGASNENSQPDLLPITYKCIRLQLQLLCNFMITDYNYNYIFPECNQFQLQLHCYVIDYNYNYFLVVPCLKKSTLIICFIVLSKLHA